MAYNPITNVTESDFSQNNPAELDFLRPNGFRFQIANIPQASYFCQAANLPQISLGSPQMETPLATLHPGQIQFGELMIRFLVQRYVELQRVTQMADWSWLP